MITVWRKPSWREEGYKYLEVLQIYKRLKEKWKPQMNTIKVTKLLVTKWNGAKVINSMHTLGMSTLKYSVYIWNRQSSIYTIWIQVLKSSEEGSTQSVSKIIPTDSVHQVSITILLVLRYCISTIMLFKLTKEYLWLTETGTIWLKYVASSTRKHRDNEQAD